jgi:hypothetical protein
MDRYGDAAVLSIVDDVHEAASVRRAADALVAATCPHA